jgi:hypothetical protein
MPWLPDPFCSFFLSACPRTVCAAVFPVLACYVLLVWASVPDAAVPAGERVFASGLVHSCLRPLSLPPSSCVAQRSVLYWCNHTGGAMPGLVAKFHLLTPALHLLETELQRRKASRKAFFSYLHVPVLRPLPSP